MEQEKLQEAINHTIKKYDKAFKSLAEIRDKNKRSNSLLYYEDNIEEIDPIERDEEIVSWLEASRQSYMNIYNKYIKKLEEGD